MRTLVVLFLITFAGALLIVGYRAGGERDPIAARGGTLFAQSCASCHGAAGEGAPNWKTADENGIFPAPPHDVTGHTWHHADGLLLRIIRDGCAAYQPESMPCAMPAFGELLEDDEMRAIIEFMRTWWGPDERAFQEEVTRDDPFP